MKSPTKSAALLAVAGIAVTSGIALSASPALAGDVVSPTFHSPSVGSKEAGSIAVSFRNVPFGCHVKTWMVKDNGKKVSAADLIDSPSATKKVRFKLSLTGIGFGTKTVKGKITKCGADNATFSRKILVVGN